MERSMASGLPVMLGLARRWVRRRPLRSQACCLPPNLLVTDAATGWHRARFTLLFIAGCAAGAWLLNGLYGINKNNATPSWCLWACAITAALWLVLHILLDARPPGGIARRLVVAGQNVLLPYLISEMLPSTMDLLHLNGWYDGLAQPDLVHAVARSAGCAAAILIASAVLNRAGFRLKL